MDITFVRHGRTELNALGCYIGSTDCDISEAGYQQAEQIKSLLRNVAYDAVFVSPLKRAIQTAQILGKEYKVDNRLQEMDFGIFEGLRYKEIQERHPKYLKAWDTDYRRFRIPGGESLDDVFDRVDGFLYHIKGNYEKILVVSHGGVIRCALSMALSSREHFYRFQVDHGSISIVSLDGDYSYIKAVNLLGDMYKTLDK